MSIRIRGIVLVITLLGAGAGLAQTGIPDLSHCEAWLGYDGPETPTVLVAPDGSGARFSEARLPDGTQVDCTIYVRVKDFLDYPICCFPREDMWLESLDDGLVPCVGGTTADVNTDLEGLTWWQEPCRAGGYSQAGMVIMLNGDDVLSQSWPVNFNSPDINGDGHVGLVDVTIFAQDFFGDYHFRSDLSRNGVLNLSDVVLLSSHLGAQCP